MVLVHTHCGVISAKVDLLLDEPGGMPPNLASIVGRVTSAVQPLVAGKKFSTKDDLVVQSMRANIQQSVNNLQTGS